MNYECIRKRQIPTSRDLTTILFRLSDSNLKHMLRMMHVLIFKSMLKSMGTYTI